MSWIDSLTPADKAELTEIRNSFDSSSCSWELYLEAAYIIFIDGPLPARVLDDTFGGLKAAMWQAISSHFEMRADGCLYLKGAR